MLSIDNIVVSVAAMDDSTAMGLVGVLQVIIVVVESICGAIL